MKHTIPILAFLILGILSGCQHMILSENPESAQLLLRIGGTAKSSRASTALPSSVQDETISSLLIYIFNTNTKALELLYEATPADISLGSMIVEASTGEKDFYVVANYNNTDYARLTRVKDVDDLRYISSDLCKLTEGNFVMTGNSLDFYVNNTENQVVDIALRRAAVRIVVAELKSDFPPSDYYNKFYLDSIYLLNAAALSSYLDPDYMFSSTKSYSRIPDVAFGFENYDIFPTPLLIDNNNKLSDTYPQGTHYYTYQNTTPQTPTFLVLTGTYSPNAYRTYYAFALEKDEVLLSNHSYELTITLKGRGTQSVEDIICGAECTIDIVNWDEYNSSIIY